MNVLIPCVFLSFLIPLLAKIKFNHTITIKEVLLQGVIVSSMCSVLYFAGSYSSLQDVEIWNGEVKSKFSKTEKCPSGWVDYSDSFCSNYSTRRKYTHTTCTTNSSGKKSCTKHYKTQYNYDYYSETRWYVKDSFRTHEIKRINPRGDSMPPRYNEVVVGDSASKRNTYTNYIKTVDDNILGFKSSDEHVNLPAYPDKIYDYYKSDKVVLAGTKLKDKKSWDLKLAESLKVIGPSKQANIVMVLTDTQDSSYRYSLEKAWKGGKKNDIIVVIGSSSGKITWADTITLAGNSGNEVLTVKLRDALLDHKDLDIKVIDVVADNVLKYFDRKAMKEFEYLKDSIEPASWLVWTCYVLSLLLSLGLTAFFHKNETI